jgi:4-hydroxy-tetrahydrodipicolinate reductase
VKKEAPLEVVIVGFGRMGHEIARVCGDRGHRIVATVDPLAGDASHRELESVPFSGQPAATVVIDFSLPEAVARTVRTCAERGWHLVIGTTGWDTRREEVLEPATQAEIGVVYGANFSLGANLFIRVAAYAQQLATRAGDYDTALVELHHRGKKDSPSGTALETGRALLQEAPGKQRLQVETLHRAIESDELHLVSARVGSIAGTHTVYFDSEADTVEITHRARSRNGFARGAVQAAEWISGRKGIHPVETFLEELFAPFRER